MVLVNPHFTFYNEDIGITGPVEKFISGAELENASRGADDAAQLTRTRQKDTDPLVTQTSRGKTTFKKDMFGCAGSFQQNQKFCLQTVTSFFSFSDAWANWDVLFWFYTPAGLGAPEGAAKSKWNPD